MRATAWFNSAVEARLAAAAAFLDRFLVVPSFKVVDRATEWIPAGDGAVARASLMSGRLATTAVRAPAVPVLIVMTVLLALLIALLSAGVLR